MKGWGQVGCGCLNLFWMNTECRIPILFSQKYAQRFPYSSPCVSSNVLLSRLSGIDPSLSKALNKKGQNLFVMPTKNDVFLTAGNLFCQSFSINQV